VAAAMRLMRRVMQRVPRAFSVVILDSLYARAAVVKLLLKHHKDVIPVLKDERRDLLQDARGLFDVEPPKEFTRGRTHYQQWDIEGFTIWPQVGRPMRVVRSLETTTRRERKGKKWKTASTTRDWVWTTTVSHGQASTQAIVELGHARWRIENQGFKELCTFWHFDHVFRHNPNAIFPAPFSQSPCHPKAATAGLFPLLRAPTDPAPTPFAAILRNRCPAPRGLDKFNGCVQNEEG